MIAAVMLAVLTSASAATVPRTSALRVGHPVPEAFAAAEVIDPDGTARRLGEAWRDGPAILIFLRHFG